MIIKCVRCGDNVLGIVINIFNPNTGQAQNPDPGTTPTASFYRIDPSIGTYVVAAPAINLANIAGIQGVWGGIADMSGVNISGMLIVAHAVVGGANRNDIEVLGGTQISVGGPRITVTPGPVVQEAKGGV